MYNYAESERNICVIILVTPFPLPTSWSCKALRAFKDRCLEITIIIIIIIIPCWVPCALHIQPHHSVSSLVLWAQSTTKDYIRAEHKLHSFSKLVISQVISQLQRITSGLNTNFTFSPSYSFHKSSHHKSCFLSLYIFHGHSTREPASGRVTYFILQDSRGIILHRNHVLATANTGEIGRGFGKNAGEWTGREEIPGSKCSMYG